jgi:hypothetical protein
MGRDSNQSGFVAYVSSAPDATATCRHRIQRPHNPRRCDAAHLLPRPGSHRGWHPVPHASRLCAGGCGTRPARTTRAAPATAHSWQTIASPPTHTHTHAPASAQPAGSELAPNSLGLLEGRGHQACAFLLDQKHGPLARLLTQFQQYDVLCPATAATASVRPHRLHGTLRSTRAYRKPAWQRPALPRMPAPLVPRAGRPGRPSAWNGDNRQGCSSSGPLRRGWPAGCSPAARRGHPRRSNPAAAGGSRAHRTCCGGPEPRRSGMHPRPSCPS